ncbi:MAG: dephospho-CoA kinase [Euryhalocaulis sp.]|uniref:dephospho-CoA kinase n=1 Tax=Euryhalocaulis sp. TaxID=2744307 RepID=UPI00182E7E0C|nr:dephospho-CoA kinase [Euryhalocaulis sp.]MBA4801515.1 dephospho-CoA kinase [Euryhalocaulis sp.]
MKIVGLTGSIGMGKTTTANMFADEGVPVFGADAAVHALYARGGDAVEPIRGIFPDAVRDGAVDRSALAAHLHENPQDFERLEEIVHPLVQAARAQFLENSKESGADIVILDIPLLYETGGEEQLDAVIVVSAPAAVQRERVLQRPGMTEEKFTAILSRQTPDSEKRKRADFVIETGAGLEAARRQVHEVLAALRGGH